MRRIANFIFSQRGRWSAGPTDGLFCKVFFLPSPVAVPSLRFFACRWLSYLISIRGVGVVGVMSEFLSGKRFAPLEPTPPHRVIRGHAETHAPSLPLHSAM